MFQHRFFDIGDLYVSSVRAISRVFISSFSILVRTLLRQGRGMKWWRAAHSWSGPTSKCNSAEQWRLSRSSSDPSASTTVILSASADADFESRYQLSYRFETTMDLTKFELIRTLGQGSFGWQERERDRLQSSSLRPFRASDSCRVRIGSIWIRSESVGKVENRQV